MTQATTPTALTPSTPAQLLGQALAGTEDLADAPVGASHREPRTRGLPDRDRGRAGVAWLGRATVFPQPVGLAATWDADLISRVGEAVGTEVRAKKAAGPSVSLNVWAPVVNPVRHPLWGRNEEGFSDDPHLTAALASAFCAGLKGPHPRYWRTVPTLKHFLGYNNEADRNVSSSQLRARVLHEYELPAYRQPIADGVAGAVMLSYNLVNGRPAHVSDLVAAHLRGWAGPGPSIASLVIVTDAGAPTSLYTAEKFFDDAPAAYAAAVLAGVDSFTDDGDNPAPTIAHLTEALRRGLLTEEDIDRSVLRLLRLRERTGELAPAQDPYADITEDSLCSSDHRGLAREAAGASVVLLRNSPAAGAVSSLPLLPLLPLGDSPGRIAVIGALGSRVLTDWYSGTPEYVVSIADGLRERYGDVVAEEAQDLVALRSVRTGLYLGCTAASAAATASGPVPGVDEMFTIQDWGGGESTLRSVATGLIVTAAEDGYLYASAERVCGWVVQETFRLCAAPDRTVAVQHIGTGRWVHLEAHTGSALLVAGTQESADRFAVRTVRTGTQAAALAAEGANLAVVVVGNDPHLGGRETQDRSTLALSQADQELVRVVREANPRTVLAVVSSYPYALGDLADTAAILWSSHGGQELGHGVADVLSGDIEPSGRLAQTWYASDEDLPGILDYDIIESHATYCYNRAEPLFPFGHGLGYGQVRFEAVGLADGSAGVLLPGSVLGLQVSVANSSSRPTSELVQVYATAPGHRFEFPRRLLVGHQRVHLAAGERREVSLAIQVDRLATFSVTAGRMQVEPGRYQLLVGPSAGNLPLDVRLEVSGEVSPDHQLGELFRAEANDCSANLALVPQTPLAGTAVAPLRTTQRATAVFRHWSGCPQDAAMIRVVSSGGGAVRLETAGPAGTWRRWVEAEVGPGFAGDLLVALPQARTGAEPPSAVRLVIEGPVTVAALRLS